MRKQRLESWQWPTQSETMLVIIHMFSNNADDFSPYKGLEKQSKSQAKYLLCLV